MGKSPELRRWTLVIKLVARTRPGRDRSKSFRGLLLCVTALPKTLISCFFVASCDFADRMAPNPKHTIHETTRNLTKQDEPMLILDVPERYCFEPIGDFLCKAC